ncbi:hypothetical protein N2152v2_004389 [Parachlorella kessleri]
MASAEARARALSGPASRGYSVASVFEQTAVLSEPQLQALDVIAASCSQRPLPKQVAEEPATPLSAPSPQPSQPALAPAAGSSPTSAAGLAIPLAQVERASTTSSELPSFVGTSFEEVVLQNSSDFYRWLAELETARSSQTEEKFRRYGAELQGHLRTCNELLAKVDELLALFERLKQQHTTVSTRTAALHATCERLVAEREALVAVAEAVRSKLNYFDELDRVAAQFNAASISLEPGELLPLLHRLDDCIAYVSNNPQYADASSYAARFRQLQARALAAVRAKVQQALRVASLQVQAAVRQGSGSLPGSAAQGATGGSSTALANGAAGQPQLAEGAEAAMLYVRFRAAAEPALKGLLQGIEQRAQQPGGAAEYGRLLADCQALYSEARVALMRGPVAQRIAQYAAQPLPAVLRSGCAYLMQARGGLGGLQASTVPRMPICGLEHGLYEHFFPGSASSPAALAPLLDPLCTLLYDVLRPALVQQQDIDGLCTLVDILKIEVLEEQLGRRGEAVAPLEPMLYRTLADVQERLTYRAQAFIREEVVGFAPKPDDLDYPAKLQQAAEHAVSAASAAAAVEGEGDEVTATAAASTNGVSAGGAAPVPTPEAAPTADVPATAAAGGDDEEAAATAALYRTWYPPVQRTLLLLSKLYRAVDAKIFSGLAQEAVAATTLSVQAAARTIMKSASLMDGQLFAIKQLLVLREQIAPFEAEFAVVERDLDFSHMRDYLRRTISGQLPLFSLGNDNAVVQLMSRGGPRVRESALDSKKDLERQLKATCEAFIMHVTKLVVEPMLSFITKVTAVKVAQQGADAAKPLREQAFASPERLAAVVAGVRQALAEALPAAVGSMRLYLPHPATRAILFKPIKSNIAEAHGQIAALMDSEYSADEVAQIGLTPPQELAALLDSLS